jgi:anti-sigma B factor antagonist
LKVKTRMEGDIAVISVSGKLMGGPESDALRNEVKNLIDEGKRKFVVNLKGVPWINSTGLGALMAVYTSIQRSEGVLRLCHVSDRIQSLFMITKLLTIFDTYPTEEEAIASF